MKDLSKINGLTNGGSLISCRRFINVSSVFCLCYEISIIGKAFQQYKHPQGRAGQRAIHEFISKGKILLDLLLLLLAVLEAISIKFYRDIKE